MKLKYDTLTIEVDYDVISIEDVLIEETLNDHGTMQITFLVSEDKAKEQVMREGANQVIRVTEGETSLFVGRLSGITMSCRKSQTILETSWESFTAKYDEERKKRAITAADYTAADIIKEVIKPYKGLFQNAFPKGEPLSQFLLQYGETDWEFLKRLAGKEGTILTPVNTSEAGVFWYGLPDGERKKIEDDRGMKHTTIRYGEYGEKNAKNPLTAFLPDSYRFQVQTKKNYRLGQPVTYGYIDCIIRSITIKSNKGQIEKIYQLSTEAGITPHTGKNPKYAGLHLTATVKEVKDTRIQADFDIEQTGGKEDIYFPYAAESSAWYCMPEKGSKVHIYIPETEEGEAYAIHSLRNTSTGAKHAAVTSDPSVKSFTHPSGSAMQMDGSRILFQADETGEVSISLGGDGNLEIKAKTIKIQAGGSLRIGKGEETPAKTIDIKAKEEILLMNGSGATAYLGEQLYLKAQKIKYQAAIHDAIEIPAEILSRNDGMAEKIAKVNATAEAMERQKIQEAKKKTGMGFFAVVAGVAAIAVVSVCTCGAGFVVAGVAFGTVAVTCGTGMVTEGVSDYQKAVETGDFSKSFNFVRDTVFQGNQALYDVFTYGSVLACGIVVGTVTGGASMEAFKSVLVRGGAEVGIDTAFSLVGDYCDDGSINNGWDNYFKSMCMTGGVSGMSMGVMNQFKKLEKAEKLSCATLEKIRLGVDVSLDGLVSFAATGEADLGKILIQNYFANKFSLSDPIDGATGSLYIPAIDMSLPDTEEAYTVSRKYESINPRVGLLGKGWTSSLESILQDRSGLVHILCTDGHIESFRKKEGIWRNEKGGSRRMSLTEGEASWSLYDTQERKTYVYGKELPSGKLLKIIDRHGNQSRYTYENGTLTGITTFTGKPIEVTIKEGKLHQIKDILGRTVTYTYENDSLVKVDQNGRGVTRYECDKEGRITGITDQNNKKYTKNEYDAKRRVIRQNYPDGTSCDITYNEEANTVSFYYPENGRRETVYHNSRYLVSKIEYQDNTTEEYRYDNWQNQIYEKDRNGNETRRQYNERGNKEKEEQPNGLVTTYKYDEADRLLEETDNEGGRIRYEYDENGHLQKKKILVESSLSYDEKRAKEQEEHTAGNVESNTNARGIEKWITETYRYDRRGRLQWKADGEGNKTTYIYHENNRSYQPDVEISPEGYEYYYTYDEAGRKYKVKTTKGSVVYGYNNLHYVARFVDAEGNVSHDEYDNLGNLIRRYSPRLCHQQGARGGNGAGYKYEYDYLDRLIKVTDPLGREKHYLRDGQGNILYESPLQVRRRIPERGKEEDIGIRSEYDANGNATNIHCPDGGEWKRQYDANGNLLSESRPENPDSKRRYTYDSMNRVIMEEDEAGNIKQYRYDKKGRIVEEINALGYHTYYRYDLAGRLTGKWEYVGEVSASVDCGILRGDTKSHQAVNERIEQEPDKNTQDGLANLKAEYQNPVEASTEQGAECHRQAKYRVTQYIYDKAGNCIEERKGIEAVEPYEITYRYTKIKKTYDRQNRLIKVEDGEGAVTEYQYDLLNNKTSERYRINEKTEKLIRYSYDKTGRLTEKRETIDCGIKGAEKRYAITKYRYDIAGNLIEIKLPEGGVIRTLYDQTDRPICQQEEDKQHGILRSRVYQYPDICPFPEETIWGKEQKVKERNQILMESNSKEGESYGGEALQKALFQENPSIVRYYMGKKATSIYKAYQREYEDIQENKPDRGKDIDHGEAGKDYFQRHNKYDFRGNLLEETDGEGNTFGYCYNKNGELIKRIEPEEYHKNGVEGAGTIFTYNSIGQLTSQSNGAGETEYRLSYDKLGRISAETDGEGNKITYSYNPTGSLMKVTRGDGSTEWQATYDLWNRPDSTTDGNGNKTCYQKDRWGRITTIIKPDKTEEHYHYDYAGNIIKAVDALGRETTFHYTSQSLVSSITKADNTTEYFSYDREGRMSNHLDRNNCLTEIIWNIDSNPVSITGRRADPEEGFAYIKESAEDREGLRTIFHVEYPEPKESDKRIYTYNPDGMLEKAAEAGTIYHYTHDRNGRMLMKTAWGKTLISCEYNKNGRIKSLETVGGKSSYEYDLAGRIKSIIGKDGLLAEYQYTRTGLQSEVRYGNGLSTRYSYDNRNQLSMLTASFPGKAPLLQANYAYDGNGNRVRKEETFGLLEPKARTHNITQVGLQDALQPELNTRMQNSVQPSLSYIGQNLQTRTEVTHYQYDSLNQLVAESRNNHHISYKYDAVGNRILRENNGIAERYSYNNRNQLVERANEAEIIRYGYDVAGNLTKEQRYQSGTEETISYQYDVFNRNTTVQGANFLQINHYDAEGYRYEVEENGIVSRFAYHYGILLAELDKDNEVTSRQYLGNEYVGGELTIKGGNVTDSINISNAKEMCYYICDEQGSIRYVLNRNGEIKNYYQYSAFGESEVAEESFYTRLHYNSQIYDELTSQYYLRARYYQPQIGRFTQEDILYADGLNLYAYCQNNPVMYSDPSGYAKATNGCDPKVQGENAGDKSGTKTGGAYKDVPANGGQVHHMPADSVSPYSRNSGPGIRMDTPDHMKTASWGRSKAAQAYRAVQKELIDKGLFSEAQQMDIENVRALFGNKYDEAIQQMLEYTGKLLK